jgi:hypothetical protein
MEGTGYIWGRYLKYSLGNWAIGCCRDTVCVVICEPSNFVLEQRNVFAMLQGLGYQKKLGKGN